MEDDPVVAKAGTLGTFGAAPAVWRNDDARRRVTTMRTPSPAQLERARRLLAYEGAGGGSAAEYATAAGRIYDKLTSRLSPLVGTAGIQALFLRSAKLAQVERDGVAGTVTLESSLKLRDSLRLLAPAVAGETAATLFATFLALITTFIGERLTTQALRSAWPTIEEPAPTETKK